LEVLTGKPLLKLGLPFTLLWAVVLVQALRGHRWVAVTAMLLGDLGYYWVAILHFQGADWTLRIRLDTRRDGAAQHAGTEVGIAPVPGERKLPAVLGGDDAQAEATEQVVVCADLEGAVGLVGLLVEMAVPPVRDDSGVHTFATVSRRK
jgi:hypothetical protein